MRSYSLNDFPMGQVQQWLWDREDGGVSDFLNGLSCNPRRLIELRYGLADGHRYSVEETADVFTKSVKWVVEIETYALFQLYQFLATAGRLQEPVGD